MTKVLSVDWLAYTRIGDSTAPSDYQGRAITTIEQNGTANSVFVKTNAKGEGETSPAGMHVNLSLSEQPGQDRWRLRISETYQNSSKNKFQGSDIMPWFKGRLKYVRVNYFIPGDFDEGASSDIYVSGGASYGEFFPASLVMSTNGAYLQAPAGCTKIAVCAAYGLASASIVTMVGLWFGAIDLKWLHFGLSATYTDYRGGAGHDIGGAGLTKDYTHNCVLVPKRRLVVALGRDIEYSATQYMFLVSPGVSVTVHARTVVPNGGAPRLLQNHYAFHGWYGSGAGPDRVVTSPAYVEAYFCSHALCSAKFDSQDKSRNLVYGASGQLLYDHATTM